MHNSTKGTWKMSNETAARRDPNKFPSTKAARRLRTLQAMGQPRGGWLVRPRLTEEQILEWADAHRAATGHWPSMTSGKLDGVDGESWSGINQALTDGRRGLSGSNTLRKLLDQHRDTSDKAGKVTRRSRWDAQKLPPYTYADILSWADEHRRITGKWPMSSTSTKGLPLGTNWGIVNRALHEGLRGLPGGITLAAFLQEHRGVRSKHNRPPLTFEKILEWADAYFATHGEWPTKASGPIPDSPPPGESWSVVHHAMGRGIRGLNRKITLALFLAEQRGVRGPLTEERILAWADAYFEEHGEWPQADSGHIPGSYGETWFNIDVALYEGYRTLPGGSTLPRLLGERRGRVPRSASRQRETCAALSALKEKKLALAEQAKEASSSEESNSSPLRLLKLCLDPHFPPGRVAGAEERPPSPRTTRSVIVYVFPGSRSGRSYMMSSIMVSMIERKARAPVPRALARLAISRARPWVNSRPAPS